MTRQVFLIVVFILTIFIISAEAQDIVIIANTSAPDDSLSRQELTNIFIGNQRNWSDRSRVVIATFKEGAVHDAFTETYLGRTSRQYDNHWKKLVFTGKGKMPDSFDTEQNMIGFVAKTAGAIGYVSAGTEIDDSVKTITIK